MNLNFCLDGLSYDWLVKCFFSSVKLVIGFVQNFFLLTDFITVQKMPLSNSTSRTLVEAVTKHFVTSSTSAFGLMLKTEHFGTTLESNVESNVSTIG